MTNEQKRKEAIKSIAMYMALSNAEEFIRSHSEGGFYFLEDEVDKEYNRAIKKVASQLSKRSLKYLKKYNDTGIDIDTESDGIMKQ